jgi:hypothetical protein
MGLSMAALAVVSMLAALALLDAAQVGGPMGDDLLRRPAPSADAATRAAVSSAARS